MVTPARPTHTGTARAEALRLATRQARHPAQPTHAFTPTAAVALEREEKARPPCTHRRARRPLDLSGGRAALALRQVEGQSIEVLVRGRTGEVRWQPVAGMLQPDQLRAWVREGF